MRADATTARFRDLHWWSGDGLRLHARDYPGGEGRPPILCLPGLTRNARDFEDLAARLSPAWRVIALDLRGRGESAPARNPMSYVPATYVDDVAALLAELGGTRVILFGTSLGGIVTMLLAASGRVRLAGAMLNDVGPTLEEAGLSRIRGYVGRPSVWPTWLHAARALAAAQGQVYPGWRIEDWLRMAKRLYRLSSTGRIVLDYDLRIAEPFLTPGREAGPDMWSALAALADVPTLVVRGARSDILGAPTAARMLAALSQGELVTVPGVGHAPMLDEPEAAAAIDRLLARVAEPAGG